MVVRLQFPGRCPVALGRTEIVAATRECHSSEAGNVEARRALRLLRVFCPAALHGSFLGSAIVNLIS